MPDQITNEDLYGSSKPQQQQPAAEPQAPPEPLVYEETPEIPMQQSNTAVAPTSVHQGGSCIRTIGIIIAFCALFAIGVGLSSYIREFIPTSSTLQKNSTTTTTPTSTESGSVNTSWKTYSVINGVTKLAILGIQYQLPADVLEPICDNSECVSQGTYLPGGTRFTIAPRGAGQRLRDFRGSVISDVSGVPFTTTKTIVGGKPATEFSGGFVGKTVSGYMFSKMRGIMIELTSTLSLEVNHFTPNGIVSDFQSDEAVFNEILKTFLINIVETGTPKAASGSAS